MRTARFHSQAVHDEQAWLTEALTSLHFQVKTLLESDIDVVEDAVRFNQQSVVVSLHDAVSVLQALVGTWAEVLTMLVELPSTEDECDIAQMLLNLHLCEVYVGFCRTGVIHDPHDWFPNVVRKMWPFISDFVSRKVQRIEVFQAVGEATAEAFTNVGKQAVPIPLDTVWFNKVLNLLWPAVQSLVEDILQRKVMGKVEAKAGVAGKLFSLKRCSLGQQAIRAKSIRSNTRLAKRSKSEHLDLIIDISMQLPSSEIIFGLAGGNVGVSNLQFDGELVITLDNLLDRPPFIGGARVCTQARTHMHTFTHSHMRRVCV